MPFTGVLAVAPVSDIDVSAAWYERLLGRPADARPMDGLADWHVTSSGWVQVFQSPEHAGSTLLNLTVDDLDATIADLADRDITVGEVQSGAQIVRFAAVHDPDGNRITLVENPVAS
ncbi:VOC family protein [Saccharopolyspora endophytica]|uniref:VOC family protein n=1 Tax=Saccharopolyspora endophytica TaxID=543886 RepID=A0ABS5DM38_9PSEU|nr:VOC family protein [Saccharopolyspora endophytica]MBQ0927364.1 VOC family protein [Saccharopolyspora endophytica]